MDMDGVVQVLEATLSPDTAMIQQAQQHLEQAAQNDLVYYNNGVLMYVLMVF